MLIWDEITDNNEYQPKVIKLFDINTNKVLKPELELQDNPYLYY